MNQTVLRYAALTLLASVYYERAARVNGKASDAYESLAKNADCLACVTLAALPKSERNAAHSLYSEFWQAFRSTRRTMAAVYQIVQEEHGMNLLALVNEVKQD